MEAMQYNDVHSLEDGAADQTMMEAVQYNDVHSLEDGPADQTMNVSLEENRDSSFVEMDSHSLNAEAVAGTFEYLPGFVDSAQESFSENSGMDMLMYPQKYKSSPSLHEEIAARHRESEHSAKFDDLEMCNDDLMFVENSTGKMFAGIVFEATPEHEEFIKKTASEASETILVPSKRQDEHCPQKIYSWAPEAGVFQHANKQETLQENGQLELPAILESLHPPNDKTCDFENANCNTSMQKSVFEMHLQNKENTSKYFEGEHCAHLVRDNISSKQHGEEHEIDEGFTISGTVNKTDGVMLLQSEENKNMFLEKEQHVNTGRAIISLKQHIEEHENDEESLILGAVSKPDLAVIQASQSEREEDSENVHWMLHVSMKGDVKTDKHVVSPEKQLERGEQPISFNASDIASRQHNEECINDGKLSMAKAFNKPDGGVKEESLRDREKSYADTNQCLSFVSEGGAEILQKAYNDSNEFNIGDLVWAKVRSHPWWPAQVFNPAHASEAAKKLEQPGRFLIAFFGDRTFAWLQKSQLIAFQPPFKKKVKQTDIKTFCKGVAEALEEFSKLSELGLICQHYQGSLHSLSTPLNGQSGNGNGVNAKHCKISPKDAERIKPAKTLEFIKCIACSPFGSCKPTLEAAELRGHAYGFRACMVSLSTTNVLQNMQAAKTLSVHHNQQKRKFSCVDLDTEAGAEAKEVKKKVKTSDVTEMEKEEDGAETLLALACYHPKLLKRLGKQRSRKDLQCRLAKKGCRQIFGRVHDSKPISGSKSPNKVSVKATTNVCHKRRKRREAQDVFSFTPSESEENLSEAGIKVLKRRKKSSNAQVPKLTRSLEGLDEPNSPKVEKPRETKVNLDMQSSPDDILENKKNRFSRLGYSIRKVAIEFTGTPPPLKCVDGLSKKTTKFRSKNKNGSTAKTMSLSKHDKAVFQASPLDECHFSTVQLHKSLMILARDPLNKANMRRPPSATISLLRYRAEVVKTKDITKVLFDDVGKAAEVSIENAQIGIEEAGEAVKDALKYTSSGWNVSGEGFSQAAQKGKQIMFEEAGGTAKDALEGDQISKVLENSSNSSASLKESWRDSSQAARKGKQILFEEAGDAADYDPEEQISKSFKMWNEKDSFQAARKGKSKIAQGAVAKSSRNCSTSIPTERLHFPAGPAPTASNTGSFRQRNYKSSARLQLGIFMRFPQNFALPAVAQLKAMFAQFGPLQPSGVKVFKDLASAQVVFTHGEDAKAAYKHVKKTTMFGRASVTYKLRQFSFSDNWKETHTFLRGSSSRAHKSIPSLEDEHVTRCLELATSLKERVNEHLRAASEPSQKRTKNGQASRTSSMQHSRKANRPTNRRSSVPLGDILQERMMTLIRRVSVIVGTPNVTPNTK